MTQKNSNRAAVSWVARVHASGQAQLYRSPAHLNGNLQFGFLKQNYRIAKPALLSTGHGERVRKIERKTRKSEVRTRRSACAPRALLHAQSGNILRPRRYWRPPEGLGNAESPDIEIVTSAGSEMRAKFAGRRPGSRLHSSLFSRPWSRLTSPSSPIRPFSVGSCPIHAKFPTRNAALATLQLPFVRMFGQFATGVARVTKIQKSALP